jgi:hypothetical protein
VAEEEEPVGTVSAKSCPVPDKLTVCGLPGALSVMLTAPLRLPPAVGLNVTLIAHLAPAPKLVPQLFVSVKFALAAMLVIVIPALPLFVRVIVCALETVPES